MKVVHARRRLGHAAGRGDGDTARSRWSRSAASRCSGTSCSSTPRYGFQDFLVACGYSGEMIKEYFRNFRLHSSDYVIDLADGSRRRSLKTDRPRLERRRRSTPASTRRPAAASCGCAAASATSRSW